MSRHFCTLMIAISIGLLAQAQSSEVFSRNGVAINGYDPVAYFKGSGPLKGDSTMVHEWKSAKWYFSSKENLDEFKKYPEKYAPQFGGFCAFGCSDGEGHKAPTKPEAWTIVDGKLYLNYNLKVKEYWSKDIKGNIEKAEKNWPSVKKQD